MGKKKKSKGGSFLMQGSILAAAGRYYHKDHRGSIPDPDAQYYGA